MQGREWEREEVEVEEADGPKCEEAGCCSENELSGTTRCQDRDEYRVKVREKVRERKRKSESGADEEMERQRGREEEGTSSCCCEEDTALFTAHESRSTQEASL